jgi:hypothetical protein
VLSLLLVAGTAKMFAADYSSSTAAGSKISNTATVTYTVGAATTSKPSAEVDVYVLQLDAFSVSPATQSVSIIANQAVSQSFTLKNLSNGPVSLAITMPTVSSDFTASTVHIYEGTGTTDIVGTTITLTQGQTVTLNVVGTAASTVTSSSSGKSIFDVADVPNASAPSGSAIASTGLWVKPTAYTTQTGELDDVGTSGAIINNVTKAFSSTSGAAYASESAGASNAITVTVTYANSGLLSSGQFVFSDPLSGTGFAYVPGSMSWNGTALSDSGSTAAGTTTSAANAGTLVSASVDNYSDTTKAQTVHFAITGIAASSSSYTLTYKVVPIDASGTLGGTTLSNTGYYNYNDSVNWYAGGSATSCVSATAATTYCKATSTATYTISKSYALTFLVEGAGQTGNGVASSSPYTSQFIAKGTSAEPIYFIQRVTNTGNTADTFKITYTNVSFPSTASWTAYEQSGTDPNPVAGTALDASGSGFTTPSIAAGTYKEFLVRVVLPANYTTSTAVSFTATATSVGSSTLSASTTDGLTAAVLPFDLATALPTVTSYTASVEKDSIGPASSVSVTGTTNLVSSITSATFELWLENNTTTTQTATLAAYSNSALSTALGSTATVTYYLQPTVASGCSSVTGLTAVTSASLTSGTPALVCAVVTPSAYWGGGATHPVYFQGTVTSLSSVSDAVYDAITITAYHNLTFVNTTGSLTVNAGATTSFTNTITNLGNVTETAVIAAASNCQTSTYPQGSSAEWTLASYTDSALTSSLSCGGSISTSLAPQGTALVYLKASPLITAAAGDEADTTLTISYNGGTTVTAVDKATVSSVSVAVTVTKYQMVSTCTALPSATSSSWVTTNLTATPGQCVFYKLAVVNATGQTATGVYVSDTINYSGNYVTYLTAVPGSWSVIPTGTTTPSSNVATYTSSTGVVLSPTLDSLTNGSEADFIFGVSVN